MWATVGPADGRPELEAVVVGEREIALARLGAETWVAFDNSCTHEDCPLADGDLDGERIVCYCHGSEFDVRTGNVLAPPATLPVKVYRTRVEGDALQIEV